MADAPQPPPPPDPPVVPPPATVTVDHARVPLLYGANGQPLIRRVGY